MKKVALSSAIALALGLSASAFANEIEESAAAQTGGAAAAEESAAASDSFNTYTKRYDLDFTKTYTTKVDMDYRKEYNLDIGVAVAASVLVGEVSGNELGGEPRAWDDITVRAYGKSSNEIDGTHTTGISAISQNIGNNNLVQQSAVVQANFDM